MTQRCTTPSCNLASWKVSTLEPVGRGEGRREGRGLRLRGEVLAGVDEEVLLKTVLLVVQLPVAAPPGEQVRVGAALDDLAALDHQDLIRAADGRQAMRDDEGGTASPRVAEPVLSNRTSAGSATPLCRRYSVSGMVPRSRPSTRIRPDSGRLNASTRLIRVLFPAPDEPTSAVVEPRGARNDTRFRTSTPGTYSKLTFSKTTSPITSPTGARSQ